jgi:esterase
MAIILPHDVIDGGSTPRSGTAIILHGILGSRRNWRSFTRRLAARYPHWRYVTVDLRGHGDAHGAAEPHTVDACARDVARLAHTLGEPPRAVIGHSFGGKIALRYAALFPAHLEAVWSLDSPPGPWRRGADGGEIRRLMDTIRALPMPAASRKRVRAHFSASGFDRSVAGWMSTNVHQVEGGVRWRFDLGVVEALMADYAATDVWDVVERPGGRVSPHIVLAGAGARWSAADRRRLLAAGSTTVHLLPDAGHWVHVDDPQGVLRALGATLGSAGPDAVAPGS